MTTTQGVSYASNSAYLDYHKLKQTPAFQGNREIIIDFGHTDKYDKSNNGKFDTTEAIKNFAKGIFSPIKAVIEHPIATLGTVGLTVAACHMVPILGPALAVGFGAYSLAQVGKGAFDTVLNITKGDYDGAEKSFNTIGEGTIGTVLSAIGVKQSAKVVQEARAMSQLGVTSLPKGIKSEIAANVSNKSFIANLKDVISMFTTKSGIKATLNQFKPNNIKAKILDLKKLLSNKNYVEQTKETKTKISTKEQIENFKKSPEGQRRAALTDEQVNAEVKNMYEKVFDELGIPKEQRPKLEIKNDAANHGGAYSNDKHQITYNPESYRSGIMEMENVMMHEATHCKEALLRAGIPQDRVEAIVKDELINRIMYGESEQCIKGADLFGANMMDPPKMSQSMKEDFVQFAKDNLYNKDNNLYKALSDYDLQTSIGQKLRNPEEYAKAQEKVAPLLEKVKTLVNKHPEFLEQYNSKEDAAINALMEYSRAHNFRYNAFADTRIKIGSEYKFNSEGIMYEETKYLDTGKLTSEQIKQAEQSLKNYIATIEGNGRTSGIGARIFGATKNEFNQYQFSPEEVLAQKNGNGYVIDQFTAKLEAMKKAGTLSAEDEAYLTKAINKAKATIEYKIKGQEYYEKYTQLLNNKDDKELAQLVKTLAEELKQLEENIDPDAYKVVTKVVREYLPINRTTVAIPTNMIYQILNSLRKQEV